MMKTIGILVLIPFILFSCRTKEDDIIELKDVAAQSSQKEGRKDGDSNNLPKVALTQLDGVELLKNNIVLNEARNCDTLLFLDRFSPKSALKFYYSLNEDSVFYMKYTFKDSTKTKNAFFNWMNCFDKKCKSIMPGESKNLQKSGFLLLQNDTSIIYISSSSQKEILSWKNYFTQMDKITWKYILSQSNSGKVNWESLKDKELTTF